MDLDDILKWSHAIIVIFSITSRTSFYRAQELIDSIKQTTDPSLLRSLSTTTNPRSTLSMYASTLTSPSSGTTPQTHTASTQSASLRRSALPNVSMVRKPTVILLANKSDLDRFRLVQKLEAEEFAKENGITYVETTAAETYKEVQTVFHSIVRMTHSHRFPKPRTTNGSIATTTTGTGRNLSSSTGTLGGTAGSVLSSLAVSPGLLLQRKGIIGGTQNTEPSSTTTADNESTTLLSTLRVRAASPPAATKQLRSPSPGMSTNSGPANTNASTPSNITQTQSFNSKQQTAVDRPVTLRATTPMSIHRTQLSQTQSTHKPITQTEDKSVKTAESTPTSATTPQKSTQGAQLLPKKSPMSFRFFSKKTKQ